MSTNSFPNPPFTFEQDDSDLVGYLRSVVPDYLSSRSRCLVSKLTEDWTGDDARAVLRQLWPTILTDALRLLKTRDSRESQAEDGAVYNPESFFNEDSLGLENLKRVLEAFEKVEPLLYGAKPEHYRDHFAHTFRVWAIGQGLLKGCLGGSLEADMPKDLGVIHPEEWEAMWALAALCHDIGYPLTAIESINENTKRALGPQGLYQASPLNYAFSPRVRPLQEGILRLMSSKVVRATLGVEGYSSEAGSGNKHHAGRAWLTHIQNKYYMKFVNSFDLLEHGVLSAMVVGKSLTYFLESDLCQDSRCPLDTEDGRQFMIRREVLRAIAAHTCPAIYHLTFNTLPFLLFIVDELQNWGRPNFEQLRSDTPSGRDAQVSIQEFGEEGIAVRIQIKDELTDEVKAEIQDQLRGKVKQRLRLALGTSGLSTRRFTYTVASEKGGELRIRLADGKIEGPEASVPDN